MKMKKRFALLMAVLMTVGILAGCGSSPKTEAAYAPDAGDYAMAESAVEAPYAAKDAMDNSGMQPTGNPQTLPQNRKWVITMYVSAETEDMDASLEAVNSHIAAMGGYVENQNFNNGSISSSHRSRSISMTVRVPAQQVDAFMQQVSGVINVVNSSRNVEDITLTYTDTESRITALKTEEARLLELMGKAENMSDLLVIEERLTEVRYQLENYSSRLRRYDNQVDYATIDLSINEVVRYTPAAQRSFWQRIGDGFVESIEDLTETVVGIVEWIIVDIPYLIVLGLLGWGTVVLVKKGHLRSQEKKAAIYQKRMQEYQAQQTRQAQQAAQQSQNPADRS